MTVLMNKSQEQMLLVLHTKKSARRLGPQGPHRGFFEGDDVKLKTMVSITVGRFEVRELRLHAG